MAITEKNRNRAEQLQFLRFLAFLFIFLWHADDWSLPFLPRENGAANGVAFFFMLSGAVTGYSALQNEIKCTPREIGSYLSGKVKKIYPLYITTTLITVSYSGIAKYIVTQNYSKLTVPVTHLCKSILLLQSWFPKYYFTFNGVGWFLSTILFLYLFKFPLIFIAGKIRKSKYNLYLFGIFMILILGAIIGYNYLTQNTNMEYWQYIFPPARLGEYIIGICIPNIIYLLENKNYKYFSKEFKVILCSLLEIGSIMLWICNMYLPMEDWEYRIVHWIIPNIVLIAIFIHGKGIISNLFRKKVLVYLGDISFECFLIHQIVIYFYNLSIDVDATEIVGRLFSIIFCLILTIMIANLAHGKAKESSLVQKA